MKVSAARTPLGLQVTAVDDSGKEKFSQHFEMGQLVLVSTFLNAAIKDEKFKTSLEMPEEMMTAFFGKGGAK